MPKIQDECWLYSRNLLQWNSNKIWK